MVGHVFCHVEIPSNDPEGTAAFYAGLFGWETETYPGVENYLGFRAPEGHGGGFSQADGLTQRAGEVIVYVYTDDIDASLAQAVELGGAVSMVKTPIPGMGAYAIFSDPAGNRIGLFQSDEA